jgi:formylglycine-generating enzyme required for sulfatase activity
MTDPLNLDALLIALREAGLRVGITEVMRLQQVFALRPESGSEPEQNRRRLQALLRAVLVKNPEDRARFERVCEAWLARADQKLQVLTAPARPQPGPGFERPEPRPAVRVQKKRLVWYVVALALALLIAIGIYFGFQQKTSTPAPHLHEVVQPEVPKPTDSTPAAIRGRRFTSWVPTLTVTPAKSVWTGWPALGLGILALFTAGGLWFTLGQRRWLPEPAPAPIRPGPPRVFLQPPPLPGPQLLDARQQEALVWGIGRFMADEPTRRLDLSATVKATARRGGIPELRFQHAYYQHEVWLWLDEAAEDAAIARLADEVEAVLNMHGLVVERASFRGIPERLITTTGAVFAPREIDERRDLAVVAVLTDGRVLARQYAADDRRVRIDALLRGLSHWPRLAFVDFSEGALAGMLERHNLERIAPAELATFLGGASSAPTPADHGQPDDAVWAAACALAPASVDEVTALALRRQLKLATSPWALRALHREAPGPVGRLQWSPSVRARRVNWLREAEADSTGGVAAGSLLDRALTFWKARYDQERRDREKNDSLSPWQNTPAQQYWLMEYNLLQLWREPAGAIQELYRLYPGRLQEAIRQQLGQLAPRGSGTEQHLQMSWSWEERTATEKAMLQEMGFGGNMPTERLRRPGRLWLGLGLCMGLMAGGFLAAWLRPTIPPAGKPVIVHGEGRLVDADDRIEPTADGRWQVSVSTPQWLGYEETGPAARINVAWNREERECIEHLADGAELWRCPAVPPLSLEIRRSLVVLMAAPGTAAAEELATALLAGGSADVVLIDPNWPHHQKELLGGHASLGGGQQLLVITAGKPSQPALLLPTGGHSVLLQAEDWSGLKVALRFQGKQPLTKVWSKARVVAGNATTFLLGGVGGCQPQEETDKPDIAFVRICPGTFKMGSPQDESGRLSTEGPVHPVTVGEFWIGKYEVTNAQYRQLIKDHQGEDNLPVVDVSWNEAKAFCEHFGYRLPTEAEWEYAARAGTQTRWSFGDNEKDLGRYAWYSDNTGGDVHPVGTREPNPWGLYDMYGNAWEWVQDCWHDNYNGAPADGSAWEGGDCSSRVLRGGAYYFSARGLRSANRYRNGPGFRDWGSGFRCVRGSRRQP